MAQQRKSTEKISKEKARYISDDFAEKNSDALALIFYNVITGFSAEITREQAEEFESFKKIIDLDEFAQTAVMKEILPEESEDIGYKPLPEDERTLEKKKELLNKKYQELERHLTSPELDENYFAKKLLDKLKKAYQKEIQEFEMIAKLNETERPIFAFIKKPNDETQQEMASKLSVLSLPALNTYFNNFFDNNENFFTFDRISSYLKEIEDFSRKIEIQKFSKNAVAQITIVIRVMKQKLQQQQQQQEKIFQDCFASIEEKLLEPISKDNKKFIALKNLIETSNYITLRKNPIEASDFISKVNQYLEDLSDGYRTRFETVIKPFRKALDDFTKSLPIPKELQDYSVKLHTEIRLLKEQAEKIDAQKYPEDRKAAIDLATDLERDRKSFFDNREFYDTEKAKTFQSKNMAIIKENKNILANHRKLLGQAIEAIGAILLVITPWTIYKALSKWVDNVNVNLPFHHPKTYQKAEKVSETIQHMPMIQNTPNTPKI